MHGLFQSQNLFVFARKVLKAVLRILLVFMIALETELVTTVCVPAKLDSLETIAPSPNANLILIAPAVGSAILTEFAVLVVLKRREVALEASLDSRARIP